jgi:hypothetical protein
MPIRRYVEESVFTPQALETMSKALEGATEALGIGSDEIIKRKAVAKLITRLAQQDVSLDTATLRDRAVSASAEASLYATSRQRQVHVMGSSVTYRQRWWP